MVAECTHSNHRIWQSGWVNGVSNGLSYFISNKNKLLKDTEDEGDHSSQCQCHTEMGHPVVKGGNSDPVGEHTLQTHKQQPCWKRHTSTHIVERFGMINLSETHGLHWSEIPENKEQNVFHILIWMCSHPFGAWVYLEVAHHEQTHGVGAARHQSAGVDPTAVAVLDHLGVAQKAHHHHCRTQRHRAHSVTVCTHNLVFFCLFLTCLNMMFMLVLQFYQIRFILLPLKGNLAWAKNVLVASQSHDKYVHIHSHT